MQRRILEGDGQPEPGPAEGALPRRVRPPEPVEDARQITRTHPDPIVAHGDCDCAGVAVDGDDDGIALAVLDRIAEQVAQDAADAAGIHLRIEVSARCDHPQLGSAPGRHRSHGVDDILDQAHQVGGLQFELDGARVVAADLQQVGQQHLEAHHLGVQQFGRPGRRRRKVLTLVVEHIPGETDGGERRSQLVRNVGDEPLLHPGELGELADLPLQAVRHAVERSGEGGDHVLSVLGDPLLELAGRELFTRLRREPDRADH